MAKYLISFPSAAMVVPDGELGVVGRRRVSPRPVGATRNCASSGSTRSPKGDTEMGGKYGQTIHSGRSRFGSDEFRR